MSPTPKKTLATFGQKRRRGYVRVFRDPAVGLVRVQWSEHGKLQTQGFADTRNGIAEAKAYAEATHDRLLATPAVSVAPLTLRALWDLYVTAKVDAWRPTTLTNKRGRWRKFELFAGKDTLAAHVTREDLDALKRLLLKQGQAPNQVKMILGVVTAVFRWGVERDRIAATKVASYRPEFSRDQRALPMEEYRAEERQQLLAAFDPRDSRQWRAWVLTVLFAYCGPRQNAARHLTWDDVDFDGGRLHWRGETDKMGNDRWQPMPAPVAEALWVAYGWRTAQGYAGRWVFYAPSSVRRRGEPSEGVYTYQAFNQQLREAEKRAGIAHKPYRAAHGFRRGIAGDLHQATGSSKDAADWIGDKSTRIVERHYLLTREDRMRELAALAGATKGTRPTPEQPTKEATE